MNSLIDKLTAMESEAAALIEQAKAKAASLDKKADEQIESIKKEMSAMLDQKILAHREEVQKKHDALAAAQDSTERKALAALDSISSDALAVQADKIVARFREI